MTSPTEPAADPRPAWPARRWRIADLRVSADDGGIDIEISMHGMLGNLVPDISSRHLAPDVRQALIAWLASADPAPTAGAPTRAQLHAQPGTAARDLPRVWAQLGATWWRVGSFGRWVQTVGPDDDDSLISLGTTEIPGAEAAQ